MADHHSSAAPTRAGSTSHWMDGSMDFVPCASGGMLIATAPRGPHVSGSSGGAQKDVRLGGEPRLEPFHHTVSRATPATSRHV